jgi:hypothetical protein
MVLDRANPESPNYSTFFILVMLQKTIESMLAQKEERLSKERHTLTHTLLSQLDGS